MIKYKQLKAGADRFVASKAPWFVAFPRDAAREVLRGNLVGFSAERDDVFRSFFEGFSSFTTYKNLEAGEIKSVLLKGSKVVFTEYCGHRMMWCAVANVEKVLKKFYEQYDVKNFQAIPTVTAPMAYNPAPWSRNCWSPY